MYRQALGKSEFRSPLLQLEGLFLLALTFQEKKNILAGSQFVGKTLQCHECTDYLGYYMALGSFVIL